MKIEFDLPEFDKELKVEIVIRRDGEVVYSTSSTPANKEESTKISKTSETTEKKKSVKASAKQETPVAEEKKETVKPGRNLGGNLMNMEF